MKAKMKDFGFIAFSPSGRRKIGTVRTRSLSEAKKKVHQMELYLASIEIQDISAPTRSPYFLFKWLTQFLFSEKFNV